MYGILPNLDDYFYGNSIPTWIEDSTVFWHISGIPTEESLSKNCHPDGHARTRPAVVEDWLNKPKGSNEECVSLRKTDIL